MNHNIHRAIGVDRRFRPERMIHSIESHEPDIVLPQEVDDGVPRTRERGYPQVAVGHNVALRKGRYGNATLSRHPILSERNIDLTIGPWKRRGCRHAAIVLNGHVGRSRRIEAFNLQLGLSARQRTQQLALLARSREMASLVSDTVCLVGGDFNDWRSLLQPFFTADLRFRPHRPRAERQEADPDLTGVFSRGPLDSIDYRGSLRLLSVRRCRLRLSRIAHRRRLRDPLTSSTLPALSDARLPLSEEPQKSVERPVQ